MYLDQVAHEHPSNVQTSQRTLATSNDKSCFTISNVTTYIRPTGAYKLCHGTNATPHDTNNTKLSK